MLVIWSISHCILYTTMGQIRRSGHQAISYCIRNATGSVALAFCQFTLRFILSMRLACVHSEWHRFEGIRELPRTYSSLTGFLFLWYLYHFNPWNKATNNRLKLKIDLNTESRKRSWNGRHRILNCVTISFRKPFW